MPRRVSDLRIRYHAPFRERLWLLVCNRFDQKIDGVCNIQKTINRRPCGFVGSGCCEDVVHDLGAVRI
jgi:hypothetical protein